MKFGKLADISQVDFRLPDDPPENERLAKSFPALDSEPMHIHLGVTGWSMPEWKGKWYPSKAKTGDFLRYYGEQFNSIELNTTHYRIPDETTIKRWKENTPPDFLFCPKVPQSISHHKTLGLGTEFIPAFCDAIAGLEEKLGRCFIQLPPYFSHQKSELLERFLQAWPTSIPLAVEVRHESWFVSPTQSAAFFALLEKYKAATVISDVAGRRDVVHMRLTSNAIVIRFVGNGLHPSDYERADAWINRILDWYKLNLREVYLFPHQPDNILAPDMAAYFAQAMAAYDNLKVRGPKTVPQNTDGDQMSLF